MPVGRAPWAKVRQWKVGALAASRALARAPYYTLLMFIVYVAVFFELCEDPAKEASERRLLLDTERGDEAYRWYTYSLLHHDRTHLGVNMLGLCAYCGLVEVFNGPLRAAAMHLLAILGGAFGVGWETRVTGEHMLVVGASGGNYGLLATQIGQLALNWPELGPIRRGVHLVVLVCAVTSDVVVNVVQHNPAVSYSAHVGGFVFGAFAGLALMRNVVRRTWERKMQLGTGAAFVCLGLAGAVNLGALGNGR